MWHKLNLLIIIAMFASGTVQATEVYKWTDDQGNVFYSDRAPRSGAKKVKVKTDFTLDEEAASRRDRAGDLLRAYDEERGINQTATTKEAKKQADLKKQCAEAKKLVENYKNSTYLYTKGRDGARKILSDEERKTAEGKAASDVAKLCK